MVAAVPKCNVLKFVYDYTLRYNMDMPLNTSKKLLVNEFLKGDVINGSQQENTPPTNDSQQYINYLLSQMRKRITVGTVTTNTISDAFFKNPILTLVINSQDFQSGQDFTQNVALGTITGINIEFATGQIITAER